MKPVILTMIIGIFVNACVLAGDDDSVNFSGGVAMGYTRLDSPTLDSSTTFPSYQVQGSTEYGDAYFSVGYATSINADDSSDRNELGTSNHTNLDLSLGYRLARRWAVFAGYKDFDTELDFNSGVDERYMQEEYGKDGYYLGGSYSLELGRPGTITLNMGYTSLDTSNVFRSGRACDLEVEECMSKPASVSQFTELSGRQNGSANGWIYGLMWLIPLSNNVAFNTTLKLNEYKEKIDYDGESYSADQKMTFFNIGVQYSF